MALIKIDDKEYDLDLLTDDAKAQITSIQFVDLEIARLQDLSAALQTARIGYFKALSDALPKAIKSSII